LSSKPEVQPSNDDNFVKVSSLSYGQDTVQIAIHLKFFDEIPQRPILMKIHLFPLKDECFNISSCDKKELYIYRFDHFWEEYKERYLIQRVFRSRRVGFSQYL
jgi:hypothetical protein